MENSMKYALKCIYGTALGKESIYWYLEFHYPKLYVVMRVNNSWLDSHELDLEPVVKYSGAA